MSQFTRLTGYTHMFLLTSRFMLFIKFEKLFKFILMSEVSIKNFQFCLIFCVEKCLRESKITLSLMYNTKLAA